MYVAAAQLLTTDLGYTLHKTALGQATLNMHTWALIEILIDQISYVLIDSARQWWSDCSKIVSNQELMDDDVQVSMARRWWLIPAQYAMGGCWNWFMSMCDDVNLYDNTVRGWEFLYHQFWRSLTRDLLIVLLRAEDETTKRALAADVTTWAWADNALVPAVIAHLVAIIGLSLHQCRPNTPKIPGICVQCLLHRYLPQKEIGQQTQIRQTWVMWCFTICIH